ncbi:hypothetical protein [Nocardia sp. NPDC057030]|uniref:hypothetical protein n=1 Tax=unclassified Nocardia TaxID=2637762 RepID=UPI003638E7D9
MGNLPRDPIHFPQMKYRAANRRQWRQIQQGFDLAASLDPDGFAAEILKALAERAGITTRPVSLRVFVPTWRA